MTRYAAAGTTLSNLTCYCSIATVSCIIVSGSLASQPPHCLGRLAGATLSYFIMVYHGLSWSVLVYLDPSCLGLSMFFLYFSICPSSCKTSSSLQDPRATAETAITSNNTPRLEVGESNVLPGAREFSIWHHAAIYSIHGVRTYIQTQVIAHNIHIHTWCRHGVIWVQERCQI